MNLDHLKIRGKVDMRKLMTAALALFLSGAVMQAHARECSGAAKRMATGTNILETGKPAQQVVAARVDDAC